MEKVAYSERDFIQLSGKTSGEIVKVNPMHPDDIDGLRAWISAKQSCDKRAGNLSIYHTMTSWLVG